MTSHSGAPSTNRPLISDLRPPVRGLILDGDGVLWKDRDPIGDLAASFSRVSDLGLAVVLATNNAMLTVDEYLAKLHGFSVFLEPQQIVTAGEATAESLVEAFPKRGTLFVVGERGLQQALRERGFEVEVEPRRSREYIAVVAGIDQDFTYAKLDKASALARAGLPFFGTNPDPTFPTPYGLVPGAGAVLAAVAAASRREPTIIGKPSPLIFETAAARMRLTADDILVVGDRLETDIAGGQAFGARTALVLSGVSTLEEAEAWSPPPTLVAADLSDLLLA